MKIAILSTTVDRAQKEIGVPLYIRYIIENLSGIMNENDIYLVHFRNNGGEDNIYNDKQEILLTPYLLPGMLGKLCAFLFKLPKELEEKNIDLFHIPAPTIYSFPILFISKTKKVMTVHDMFSFTTSFEFNVFSLYHLKAWFSNKLRKFIYYPLAKRKVDGFIAVSKSVRDKLVEYLDIPEEKISVIYEAVSPVFQKKENPEPVNYKDFILAYPTRREIIKIFYQLKQRGVTCKLICFGDASGLEKHRINQLVNELDLKKDIHFTGYLRQEKLVDFYNRAKLYMTYMEAEGFGLTPLEAMTCGCPVVASRIGSLPEVVGEAGLLVKDNDQKQWIEKTHKLIKDKLLRQKLTQKGLKRAKKFTWKKTIKDTVNFYEETLDLND